MSRIPEPRYDYQIEKLTRAYKRGIAAILAELDRIDIPNMSRTHAAAALVEVTKILAELNEESAAWVAENIPLAARNGVLTALVSLDVKDAESVAKFNRMNSDMVKTAVADTQSDLLAVTQNVERKVRTSVRQVMAESMRLNMASGITYSRTISRDVLTGLRKRLGDSVNTGIIAASGRRWRPEVYAEMVTKTKLMSTQIDATINESVARGAVYGVISIHGASDACRFHEGRIVKLVVGAEGSYPTIDELRSSGQIFHPNCRHVISPIRNIDKLTSDRKEFAARQSMLGDRAIATGKRTPTQADLSPFEKRPDISVPQDLGAAGRRLYVRDPMAVRHSQKLILKPGSYVTGVYVFAKGTDIREVDRLIRMYPDTKGTLTTPSDWEKVRGRATVVADDGTEREAEIHWYQARQVGEVEIKLKRYFT